jgi:hypothetical protein
LTHRDKERAKSLEYARSEGWIDPVTATLLAQASGQGVIVRNDTEHEAAILGIDKPRVIADEELTALRDKIADLEVALATERESHAVTKRAVTRGTRARCAALEEALRGVLWAAGEIDVGGSSDETREAIAEGEALLK